jgi:uncharacterized protein
MSASRMLDRIKALRPASRSAVAASVSVGSRGYSADIPEGAARLAKLLEATPRSNEFGEHLVLRRWFSSAIGRAATSLHARSSATMGDAIDLEALRLIAPEAPECVADQRQWLFLDTETTGLTGGTGTYPFLIGIAWWDAGGLEIEQFFMREQSEEHSVLVALAERMADRRVLVTFNGRSFDWPLLETRYRMTRKIKPPAPRAHLDFLHPARNLWRLRLGSVRLAELEKHVLGWHRGADILSEMIPQIYFDYLRGGSPDALVPIFEHNQMDLRGLAALSMRILALLANPELHGQDPLELFGMSRICERRGESRRARQLYEHSITKKLPPDTDRIARHALARLAKRDGHHDAARELWEGILGNSREGFEAYEQLAIYYEHRARDAQRAAALAREALAELRKLNRLGALAPNAYRGRKIRFEKRLARLERKASRGLLAAMEAESRTPAMESN